MLEALLIGAVILGLFAGGVLVARSPSFWIGLVTVMIQAALPIIAKRMDPEDEARWRKCMATGGRWDMQKKKCIYK
jgi:hypothetical protein